ncbi:MAG: DUF3795 domain-containing protein [Candidatus Edwardsbacteria bacterium]
MINYEEEKQKYVSFCGFYCRNCDSFTGKKQRTAQRALDIIKRKETEFERLFEDKDIRENIIKILTKQALWLCPGCKALVNDPKAGYICKIRQCCSNKNLDLCSECEEYPCKMLINHPTVIKLHGVENLMKIKEKGIKQWLDEQKMRRCFDE